MMTNPSNSNPLNVNPPDDSNSMNITPPSDSSPAMDIQKTDPSKVVLPVQIHSLNQLKDVLIDYYGKKKGTSMYDEFIQGFVIMMLDSIQSAEKQAESAAKQMQQIQGQ